MEIKDKLGQLFLFGFDGLFAPDEVIDFIQKSKAAGIILFKYNYESPAQLAELCNQLQESRKEAPPLFIGVDHEGGRVWRFGGLSKFPPMQYFGNINSPKTTFEAHQAMAAELLSIGVNLNFAPVADVNTNPKSPIIGDRAFADDANVVSSHVSAAVRGFVSKGLICCVKHYPGHGDTKIDSHQALPKINKSWEELENCELKPFKKSLRSKADMVMTAHILNESIDPKNPVTMSEPALEYLRKTLPFKGIIVSDDMEMKAISDHYEIGEAAIKALNAGCDLLIYKTFSKFKSAYEACLKALEEGTLSSEKIETSYSRIRDIKIKHPEMGKSINIPTCGKKIGEEATLALVKKVEKEGRPTA